MPLTLTEIKSLHDKAFESGQVNRERGADDTVFFWLTHWGDTAWGMSLLEYRGEFDMLHSAVTDTQSELDANQVQNDFEAIGDTPEETADLADGLYRRGANSNSSIEAFKVAMQECTICGVGAWVIETEYKSNRTGDKKQRIVRRPVYEANNNGFWDPNAKSIDKSDADYYSLLWAYSEDGYKKLVNEHTGEEPETNSDGSFAFPEHSYTFPWVGGEGKKIYVVEFYHREKVKEKILTMADPFGGTQILRERSLTTVMDEMLDLGYSIVDEKEIEVWEVRKYIASGGEILNGKEVDGERTGERIAGENIPVVPEYGKVAIVEGEVHYEGEVRRAKDPQMMRDFSYSYVTDLFSKGPREKPIFTKEQIAGFEYMYDMSGPDNNFPYLLQNSVDANGKDLPIGPIATMPAPNIPPALAAAIELSTSAIREVANAGMPKEIEDVDLSGKAYQQIRSTLGQQNVVYQENRKFAIRRDAVIWISMAAEIHDIPSKEKIELPDGTKKDVQIMESVIDEESGEPVFLNDLRTAEFEITSTIGPSYSSQREQSMDRLEKTLAGMQPDDPLRPLYQVQIAMLTDGVDMKMIQKQARKMSILKGWLEPETDEEKALLEQAQSQPSEPDAATLLAQAEQTKGDADMLNAQREGVKLNLDDENAKMKNSIDMFKAETERMSLQVDAQEAGAKITKTGADTMGVNLDNQAKIKEIQTRSVEDMSTDELMQELMSA